MPAERTTMRQVREIVRLHQAGMSTREIGIRVGVAASTVRLTMRRVAAAGMVDGIPADQTDAALEKLLFTGSAKRRATAAVPIRIGRRSIRNSSASTSR